MYYRRKIDEYLNGWKADLEHKPLIVKGARQIGKTESILHFAGENYENVVYINFALESYLQKMFKRVISRLFCNKNLAGNQALLAKDLFHNHIRLYRQQKKSILF